MISAGFAEVGSDGAVLQDRLLALVRSHGARLIGPNCLGVASASASLNATFAPQAFPPGSIGFSSQSGALGLALLAQAQGRGLGFSSFVSIGNKADVSSNDLLEYWEDDSATAVLLLYLESFGNPKRFGRIARRVARTKPILAMKSGVTGSGSRAASSHTAALAGSEAAVSALFREAGVTRCDTLEELIDVAALFSRHPLTQGGRVAVLTNAGGLGILCADACDAAGLELPPLSEETRAALAAALPPEASLSNPVDMLGSASSELYERTLPLLLEDPGVDAVIVIFVPAASVTVEDVGAAIDRVRSVGESRSPGSPGGPDTRDPFRTRNPPPERSAGPPSEPSGSGSRSAPESSSTTSILGPAPSWSRVPSARTDDVWLAPDEVRRLLEAYGISLVPERYATGPQQALVEAAELGYPVVLKTAEAGAHKTEQGGVALDLTDPAEVRLAAERIGGPLVVQPMIEEGVELLAGVVQDPVFGTLGGVRPGRRPGRADRRGAILPGPDRRHECSGARPRRQGRSSRRWLPRPPRG